MSRTSNNKSNRIGRNGRWRNGATKYPKYAEPLKRYARADDCHAQTRLHGDHIKGQPITIGLVSKLTTITNVMALIYKTGDFHPVHKREELNGWGSSEYKRKQKGLGAI